MQLLQALARQLQLSIRCVLRFLDERVENDDAFAQKKAVEGAPNTRPTTESKFEEPIAERSRVGEAQDWAVLRQQLDKARVVSQDVDWPRLHLCENTFVEVLNFERHARMLANTLTRCNEHGY